MWHLCRGFQVPIKLNFDKHHRLLLSLSIKYPILTLQGWCLCFGYLLCYRDKDYTVNVLSSEGVDLTDSYLLYCSTLIYKLCKKVRGQFVVLSNISVHRITCNSGDVWGMMNCSTCPPKRQVSSNMGRRNRVDISFRLIKCQISMGCHVMND